MLTLAKFLAAIVLNVTSGRVTVTPITDYHDTVIMDMECDVDPDCDITIPSKGTR